MSSPSSGRSVWPRLLWVFVALALVASACGGGEEGGATTTPERELPRTFFVADTVGGGQIDLGDLQGQDIVLWFWAPW